MNNKNIGFIKPNMEVKISIDSHPYSQFGYLYGNVEKVEEVTTNFTKDLIPYGLAVGNRATLEGLNLTGLRRRNFNNEEIKKAKKKGVKLLAYSCKVKDNEISINKRINFFDVLKLVTRKLQYNVVI